MNLFEIARRWMVAVVAEILNTSTAVIETLLPNQPAWLARIKLLETQLRTAANSPGHTDGRGSAASQSTEPELDPGALLASHVILHEALTDLKVRGLALDEDLLKRMRTDWSAESIIGYLQAAESQLRTKVSDALAGAAEPLAKGVTVGRSALAHEVLGGAPPEGTATADGKQRLQA